MNKPREEEVEISKELTMDLENWKEQLKEDWGLDDVAGVYYKGYSLGHQMDDLESYISKLLSSQLKEVHRILVKWNTHYQLEPLNRDMWTIEQSDIDRITPLTEEELLQRSIGAVTAISNINRDLKAEVEKLV